MLVERQEAPIRNWTPIERFKLDNGCRFHYGWLCEWVWFLNEIDADAYCKMANATRFELYDEKDKDGKILTFCTMR